MSKLELDSSELTRIYPASITTLEKMSETTLQEHEEILYSRKELLAEIKHSRPRAFQVISDSLKFNPAER